MERKILLLCLISILLISLNACSDDQNISPSHQVNNHRRVDGAGYIACPQHPKTATATPEKGDVTLDVAFATSTPAEESRVRLNIQRFEATHPHIKVRYQNIGNGYPDKMYANIAGGTVPDAFYLQVDMASEYIPNNKLLNLSPYMARDNVQASDYFPALLSPFSCRDGQIYGIAKDWSTLGIFYNKRLFQQAHVAFPATDWTWADMREIAHKLTRTGNAGNSTYGITLDADPSRWLAFLFSNGGTVLNEDGSKATFNSPEGRASLTFYTSFEKAHTSVPARVVGASWPGEAFGKERAAMALEGGWLIPYLTQFYPAINYDIAPLPLAPSGKRSNLLFTQAWGGYAGTKHPDATWQFIRYMTSRDAQLVQLHAGLALPSLKSLANDNYFLQHPGFKQMFDAASTGHADYYGPHNTYIYNTLKYAIDEVFHDVQDVAGALRKAEQKINNELLSAGDT